jgi:hypothetical protein
MSDRQLILKDGPLEGAVFPVIEDAVGISIHFGRGVDRVSYYYSSTFATDAEGREIWAQQPRRYDYPIR